MAVPFDYRQFRTPFYEIYVANTTTGNFIKLPDQIMRLMDRMEVVLAAPTESCLQTTATISFATGSREPFPAINTSDASSIYGSPGQTKDNLTNAITMLADLKVNFNGNSVNFSALANQASSAISAVSNLISGQTESQKEVTKSKGKNGGGYLFEEGNALRLVWGYRSIGEIPEESKTITLTITMVQMEYPENDHSKLTVICQSGDTYANKISPTIAKNYFMKLPSGVDPVAGVTSTYKGLSTQQVIQKICSEAGFDFILSKQLTASIPEKDTFITWPAGMSLLEFLKELAFKHNAVVSIDYHSRTGKPTIRFISRLDYYGQKILPDSLFHFKRAGSIIKSINIRADYGNPTGAGHLGMDSKGVVIGAVHEVPESSHITLAEGEGLLDTVDSVKKQPSFKQLSDKVSEGNVIGKASYNAATKQTILKSQSSSSSNCVGRKSVILEFTSIGHPLLRPGIIKINGIGQRYSNTYKLNTVTHTIDSSGYQCQVSAVSDASPKDGAIGADGTPVKEPKDTKDTLQLADPQAALNAVNGLLLADTEVEPPITGTDSETIDENDDFEKTMPSTIVIGSA